jgi:glutathione peroxidase-family protein
MIVDMSNSVIYSAHIKVLEQIYDHYSVNGHRTVAFPSWFEQITKGKLGLEHTPESVASIYDIATISFKREQDYHEFLLTWG